MTRRAFCLTVIVTYLPGHPEDSVNDGLCVWLSVVFQANRYGQVEKDSCLLLQVGEPWSELVIYNLASGLGHRRAHPASLYLISSLLFCRLKAKAKPFNSWILSDSMKSTHCRLGFLFILRVSKIQLYGNNFWFSSYFEYDCPLTST